MLKRFISCIVLLGIGQGLFGASNSYIYDDREDILRSLNINKVAYHYNAKKNQCVRTDTGLKDFLVRNIKNGNIELRQVFDSIPGELYLFRVRTENRVDEFVTTTTYGACQLYIDSTIEKRDINDVEAYVGLELAK